MRPLIQPACPQLTQFLCGERAREEACLLPTTPLWRTENKAAKPPSSNQDPPHARRSKRQHRGPLLTRAPVACGPTTRRRSRLPKNLAALGLEPRILESKSPRHRRSHGLRAKGSSLFGSATTNTPRILDYLPAAKPPPHHRKTCGLVTAKPPYLGPISAQREVIQQPHKQTTSAEGRHR